MRDCHKSTSATLSRAHSWILCVYQVHMTTRSVASLSVHHKRKPHRPSRPAAVPDNIRTVLVLRVSPFRVILSDLLMTRIVRMLKRTAATFNADAVSGAYMDRVKMVAISRRFGFITPSVSSGSVSASVGAGDSIAPMASFGDVNTSSAKEGRVFIDAAASQVKLVIPLLERGSREVDPALATTGDPPPPPPPIFITAADSLAWAYDRRTGPVFRSNVMPVRLTHSANGEWEYLDSTSTEITEAMLLRVELSGCAVATFLPESSDAPRSLVADTDDDPESRAAKYSDWLACSHAYDAIRASINAVDVHFCQVAVSPPLPAVEASWMLSDSLPVIWKAAILRLVDPQLAVWRTTSPDHQRFPRAMVEVGVPSVRIIVSPEYVAPLTSLASVWAASLASTADKTSEPSAAVRQLPRVMLARESSNASLPERSARRANTFLRLRATTTVHVRIRADVPSVEVVLIGPRCADGPPSRSELFILRLQGLGLRYSHTVKAYEAKLDLSQLVVEYSGSAVGTDPGTTSSLLCIGIPTVDHTGDGTDPTPTPSQPSIGALSLAVRQSGNTHLAYLGSANLCVDCRLGLISIALPFLAVEDVKMCVDELLTSAAAARALAARVSPKGVSVSVPVPSSESFTPGTLPVAASTPITTPSTHGPTAGEKDDGLRTQSFVGWEKLFQKLEGAVGGFAELPALVTTLRTAHGSTAAPDADQQRVRPACALLHVRVCFQIVIFLYTCQFSLSFTGCDRL